MSEMTRAQKIRAFNESNAPFYLVDHEDEVSLCCVFHPMPDSVFSLGQEAFNRYAERIGDPVKDEYGLYTHGSGYEWEYVFRKAFENDPNIGKVSYDCEAGGFFCYGESVDMMADFGRRFRQIMNDTDSLTDLICKAVPEGEQREAELQQLRSTVRGFLISDRSFSVPELKILIDAVQAASFITEKKSKELIDKIADLGGSHRAEILKNNIVRFNTRKHSNEAIYYNVGFLEEAIQQNRKIIFRYFDLNEVGEKVYRREGHHYVVEPVGLVFNEDNYYLVCYSASLFEEGDYEVALDYELTEDKLIDSEAHYRIFFKFSIRNGNCMVYPFDVATGEELTNSSMTENGFRLDLAKSRYLKVIVKREVMAESADGLVEDTRFNGPAKDGAEYTTDGIYTITVTNQYTNQLTVKKIYVGTNPVLRAYMTTGLSIPEINSLVAEGAVINEDGTIQLATVTTTEPEVKPTEDTPIVKPIETEPEDTSVPEEAESSRNIPLYGGIGVVAVAVIAIIAIAVVVKKKKEKTNHNVMNEDEGGNNQ